MELTFNKLRNIGTLFIILLVILTNNVNAKEQLYTPAYTFKVRNTIDGSVIKDVNIGDKIKIVEFINPFMSKISINDSEEKFFLYNNGAILPFERLDEYRKYIKENSSLEKEVAYKSQSSLKDIYNNEELLEEYTKDFVIKGKSDKEKLLEVLNYINNKNIIYNFSDSIPDGYEHNDYQVKTLPEGLTKCNGVTMLASYLFNKVNLEYRLVVSISYNYKRNEFKPGPSHIYNEVKIDKTWYKIDLTNILGYERQITRPYYKITKGFYDNNFVLDEDFPSLPIITDKDYKDIFFWTSKIFNPKENIENNVEYNYIWTSKNNYQAYKLFK